MAIGGWCGGRRFTLLLGDIAPDSSRHVRTGYSSDLLLEHHADVNQLHAKFNQPPWI